MKARAMVERLNELNARVCAEFGIAALSDAQNLDEAIAVSTTTVDFLMARGDSTPAEPSIAEFLRAQVEARRLRDSRRVHVVRALTAGVRRMKKAGSLHALGRQACSELCDEFGFDTAVLSYVEDGAFVVEESEHCFGGPTVVSRQDCKVESACIQLRDTVATDEQRMPASAVYAELLGSARYIAAPVIAAARVVALLHVGRDSLESVSSDDVELLDAFVSAYSLLHEKILNAEQVQQQCNSIARAAALLTEQADRIANSVITFDLDHDSPVGPAPRVPSDSGLAASLSHRERQVFELLVAGASNADIADQLVITVETVKTHVKRILRKVGAINRSEAIALYMEDTRPGGWGNPQKR